MKCLTVGLAVTALLASTGICSASDRGHPLFSVIDPVHTLFTVGSGDKRVTLKLADDSVTQLKIELFDAEPAVTGGEARVVQRLSPVATSGGHASLELGLPHPGLFDVQVTALDVSGQAIGQQAFRIARLGTEVQAPIHSMGVGTHFSRRKAELPGTISLVRRAGFGRIRDELPWSIVERQPGQFKFPDYYDRYILDAVRAGIDPLITLDFANTRAYRHLLTPGSNFLATGEPMRLFQKYVRAVVGRYGRDVHTWELWNEPNLSQNGVAERYAELLKLTYQTLDEIAPEDTLVACGGGGVAGGPNGECFLSMLRYGAGMAMDGYSIHPYMGTNNPPEAGYAAHKSVIARVNVPVVWKYNQKLIDKFRSRTKSHVALWVTEIGWFTRPVTHPDSELKQAAYIDQLYLLCRKYSQAQAVFWYDFQDDGDNPSNKEHNFGLITYDYQPKPSYIAMSTLTRTLGDRPWVRSLKTAHPQAHQRIEQYGEGQNAVAAAWTNSKPATVQLPVADGRYIVRKWDGQELIVQARGHKIALRIGELPVYVSRAD